MKETKAFMAVKTALPAALLLALCSSLLGQSGSTKKDTTTNAAPTTNTQTVNAQQSGAWTVGVDPAKNTVKVATSPSDPLAVKPVPSGRTRIQFRIGVNLTAGQTSGSTGFNIPAGKRFVIEHISGIALVAPGERPSLDFWGGVDNGDNVENGTLTFHRVPLISQGVYSNLERFVATLTTQVYFENPGTWTYMSVNVQFMRNGGTGSALSQIAFSGYLEDLAATP